MKNLPLFISEKSTSPPLIATESRVKNSFKGLIESYDQVHNLIKPLNKLGITGFFYSRIFADGQWSNLSGNLNFSEHFLKKVYEEKYTPSDSREGVFIEKGLLLWSLNPENPIIKDGADIFNYGNGITFSTKNSAESYQEVYAFYSDRDNHAINQFYLSNLDFLENFKNYFLDEAKDLVAKANNLKYPSLNLPSPSSGNIFLPELSNLSASMKPTLSKQERSCLNLLSNGKSSGEIAETLKLSQRTVENYLANIRMKWDCKKSAELIYLASKKGFI